MTTTTGLSDERRAALKTALAPDPLDDRDDTRAFIAYALADHWDDPTVPQVAWDAASMLISGNGMEADFREAVCRLVDYAQLLQSRGTCLEMRHLREFDQAYADVGAAIERWKRDA